MYEVTVDLFFSAAHHLRDYKGKCEAMHGHNWKVSASVASDTLNKSGMVADFKDLKGALAEVLDGLDHTCVNELPYFKEVNPTSESISKYIFDELKKNGLAVKEVVVWESRDSSAKYSE